VDAPQNTVGRAVGHAIALLEGAAEEITGGSAAAAGIAGAPETGGASLAVTAGGAALAVHGAAVQANTLRNIANGSSDSGGSGRGDTGSYTNTHESGKTYDGKGGKQRSQDSGKRVEKETGDKHVATDWTPAKNSREAYKDESRRLDSHGGPNSPNNYNKRESPGKKFRQQDGN
jgi:hypothetical protein